ncbi:TPA: DUF551 domain-containing protein [Klebsiella pneumoniae]|nr:DUF551 domain-containing protein [Klebsiella pneumoniae]
MTKSTITRERLEWLSQISCRDDIEDIGGDEIRELASIALAAMDSEPAIADCDPEVYEKGVSVCLVAIPKETAEVICQNITAATGCKVDWHYFGGRVHIKVLRVDSQPAPEHPEVLPCSVLLEPGLRFGKGIKTSTMLAALARRAVYESDMAALSPEERAEFQAGIEGFKALIAQPVPVVPEEKPIPNTLSMYAVDAVAAIAEVKGWNACRAAMLAADPQLPGSDPATVPGKWIPVSEQMPPSRHEVLVGRWWGEKPRWCCKWATYIPGHPDSQSSGWLIPGASWTPTHWMPLPAAPQEVR